MTIEGLQQRVRELELELAESRRLSKKVSLQNQHLAGIHEATLKLTSCHNLSELLHAIVSRIAAMAGTPHAYISLHNDETDMLEIKLGAGLFEEFIGEQTEVTLGLTGQVFQSGQLMVMNDYQSWHGRRMDAHLKDVQAMAVAPIKHNGKNIGVIGLVHDDKERVIDEDEIDIIKKFSDSASLAFENATIYENSQKHNDELKTLYEITLDMTSLLDTDHVLDIIIERAAGLAGSTSGYVFLIKPDAETMELKVGIGLYADSIGYALERGKGLAGKVWQTGEHMVVNEYRTWEGRHPDPKWDPIKAIAGIPLKVRGGVVGLIGLMHTEKGRKFKDADIKILTKLAELATLSLNNAMLFEQISDLKCSVISTLEETIQAVAHTVEIRDPYTAGHQRRVAILSCAIARKMNLPEDQIKGIEMAATIHDIGKLYVPSELLSKPCKLMDIEFNVIRHHAQAGYDILKDTKFPWPIATVVYQHHEKMNGKGYPCGVSGDEIILEARIVSVADVVEAISSHRPYRPSLGFDAAIKEITAKKGIDFDPIVVDACIEVLKEGIHLDGWR